MDGAIIGLVGVLLGAQLAQSTFIWRKLGQLEQMIKDHIRNNGGKEDG